MKLLLILFLAATSCQGSTAEGNVSTATRIDTIAPIQTEQVMLPSRDSLPHWLPGSASELKHLLTGRIDPSKDTNFMTLPSKYSDQDGPYLLRKEAAMALMTMIDAAANDGVQLQVISATRNFERQSKIWAAKWRGERTLSNGINLAQTTMSDSAKARMILLYSSMPGTSRHHWGTDVDLNNLNNSYFDSGRGQREYAWLQQHATEYGFFQPYTSKSQGRSGYEEERWHWSYGPLSQKLLELYQLEVSYADIQGFPGAEVAEKVGAIEEYVLGIEK